MRKKIQILAALLSVGTLLSGCYYDVEQELYPPQGCDVTNVTYSATISPIIQARCATPGCHAPGGNSTDFTTYAGLQPSVSGGQFQQRVLVQKTMPPSGSLGACDLNKLQIWLNAGGPNN